MTQAVVDTLAACEECGKQPDGDEKFCRGCGAPLGPDPLVGTVLEDRYEVKRRLGAGAMGAVYEVRHQRLGKRFAMKIIRRSFSGEADFAARFEQEALSTSRLEHPNCIAVTDYGKTADGLLYLVMEYLEGTPLSEFRTPLPAARALEFVRQILLGLQHAHRAGVVHRDVKPENVMVLDYDGVVGDRLKVLDFGIAKLPLDVARRTDNGASSSSRLTEAGVVFGTPDYMAPEQALGSADVDERADLYAVGVILWILLTGRPPFEADNSVELLQRKLAEDPPSLDSVCPGVFSAKLRRLVQQALARNPRQRIASAETFLAGIEEVSAEPARGLAVNDSAGRWHSVSTSLQRVAVPFRRVSTCYQSWYGCAHVERPSWKERARALLTTTAGRVVLGSALALLLISSFTLSWALSDDNRAVVKVTGEKIGEAPKQPALAARDDGADKETAKQLVVARQLLAKYACREAARELKKLVKQQPKLAQAHYLRGAALICRGDARAGIKAYARAIELEPSYKEDERVIEDVGGLMTSKRRGTRLRAVDFMTETVGKPALPMLLSAAVNRDRVVRERGRAAVIKLGASSRIDWVTSLHLDLKQLSCRKIKQQRVIERLSAIDDPRVLPILKQALKARAGFFRHRYRYGCVRRKLKAIVKELGTGSTHSTK